VIFLKRSNTQGVPPKKIYLYFDEPNPPYAGLITNFITIAREFGMDVISPASRVDHLSDFEICEGDDGDIAVILGGDGTILRGMDFFRGENIPVLGINAGHLGFLASAEKENMEQALFKLSKGDYYLESLPQLCAEYPSGHKLTAINDICINRSMMGGIPHFEILVGDASVAHLSADGMIISTPLGSTAYGLSCGGPILDPELPAMLVIPICPHSLSLRPLVVPDTVCVRIRISSLRGTGSVVSADGVPGKTLKEGEILKVTKDSQSCPVVKFHDQDDYYHRLGEKLGWGLRK